MTAAADELPDTAPLPRGVLELVREQRRAADAAERAILALAVQWAHAHPVEPGGEAWRPTPAPTPALLHPVDLTGPDPEVLDGWSEDDIAWAGIPEVAWDAPAAFAAANSMPTAAGKALIRDALVLAHRCPQTWRLLARGRGTARAARQVAEALLTQPDDVCARVDTDVADRIRRGHSVGRVVLARLVDTALMELHAEARELDQLDALDTRHVTLDPTSINHTGIGELTARGDWVDLAALDDAVALVAGIIADHPEVPAAHGESLDTRRSMALGILADPARAHALITGLEHAEPTRVRGLNAFFHLTEPQILGLDPTLVDTDGVAWLDALLRAWTGRPDMHLTVKPIRHCGGASGGCVDCPGEVPCPLNGTTHGRLQTHKHDPSQKDKDVVALRDRTCVHPHCHRAARATDCDHIVPFSPPDPSDPDPPPQSPDRPGGATCPRCNLAPLCRHHHRLKTLAGWRYWMLAPATYLWRDPHGFLYLRTPDGTRALD